MRGKVLLYHSHNISGSDYASNDHVALAADLEAIHASGARIESLRGIAGRVGRGEIDGEGPLVVGLSFDDGPVFDYRDFDHPQFGPQRGFLNILRDFRGQHGEAAQPGLHATSFVIASKEARAAMQKACGYDYVPDWLGDAWWKEAAATGLLEIGNHSWDHVHEAPSAIAIKSAARGDFSLVNTHDEADVEIRQAGDYISGRLGSPCRLFAFPFGHSNAFLTGEYLPRHREEHGMVAAFGATGGEIDSTTSIWNIPRWSCGYHWRSPRELDRLLWHSPC